MVSHAILHGTLREFAGAFSVVYSRCKCVLGPGFAAIHIQHTCHLFQPTATFERRFLPRFLVDPWAASCLWLNNVYCRCKRDHMADNEANRLHWSYSSTSCHKSGQWFRIMKNVTKALCILQIYWCLHDRDTVEVWQWFIESGGVN